MKLLTRADNIVLAHHWANVLRAAGIPCEVRNTALVGAMGEIPFLEAAPQLWVHHTLDLTRARIVLDELREPPSGTPWDCTACGEAIEPQFGACWKCGTTRAVSL